MIGSQEIRGALKGSWLLFCNRAEGVRYFDCSIEGFWRSFQVAFLLLPYLIISGFVQKRLILEEANVSPENFASSDYWVAQIFSYVADWIGMPLVLAALAGLIGISRTYVPYVAIRNWAALLSTLPHAVIGLLYVVGLLSSGMMILFSLCAFIVVLWFHFRIACQVLQAGIAVAAGVVIMDVLLSIFLEEMIGRLWIG